MQAESSGFFDGCFCSVSVLLPMFYVATIMPFEIFFVDNTAVTSWLTIDGIVSVSFFIDMMVTINTGYYDDAGWTVIDRSGRSHGHRRHWPAPRVSRDELAVPCWFSQARHIDSLRKGVFLVGHHQLATHWWVPA